MTTLRLGGKIWHWPQNERTIWILRSSCPILGIVISWWPGIRLQKAVDRLHIINGSFHNNSSPIGAFMVMMISFFAKFVKPSQSSGHLDWTFTNECCTKKWFCHEKCLTILWCFNRIMRKWLFLEVHQLYLNVQDLPYTAPHQTLIGVDGSFF